MGSGTTIIILLVVGVVIFFAWKKGYLKKLGIGGAAGGTGITQQQSDADTLEGLQFGYVMGHCEGPCKQQGPKCDACIKSASSK